MNRTEHMSDIKLIETGNGGDIELIGKDLAMLEGFGNMIYLALFGGNPQGRSSSAPTGKRIPTEQAFDWWGNNLLMPNDLGQQFNSLTEYTLNTTALNSSGRIQIEQAVLKDLAFMKDFATVSVTVTIEHVDRVRITIKLQEPDNIEQKEFQYIWDGTKQDLIGTKPSPNIVIIPPTPPEPETIAYLGVLGIGNDSTIYYPGTNQEITGTQIWAAVNTYFVGAKAANILTKLKAIYWFIGGTATRHKYNAIDPRDVDAAFRIIFNGGWVHDKMGVTPNGTSAYADSKFNPNVNASGSSLHMGTYREQYTVGVTIGCTDGSSFLFDYSSFPGYALNTASFSAFAQVLNGMIIGTRTNGSPTFDVVKNTRIENISIVHSTRPNANIYFGAYNNGGTAAFFTDGVYKTVTIGDGLTTTEARTLDHLSKQLQYALHRTMASYTFFGDSITDGLLNVTEAQKFATLLCTAKTKLQVNYGIPSTGLPQLLLDMSGIPQKGNSYSKLFFAYGMNDWGIYKETPTTYKTNYQQIIDNCISKGWLPADIIIIGPFYPLDAAIATYFANFGTTITRAEMIALVAATSQIAALNGCPYIDMYALMEANSPATLINADGVHPNAAGHTFIFNQLNAFI